MTRRVQLLMRAAVWLVINLAWACVISATGMSSGAAFILGLPVGAASFLFVSSLRFRDA